MTTEDWAETSPFIFGGLLVCIAVSKVPPSMHAQFDLRSGDLIALPPYYVLRYPGAPNSIADGSDWDEVHLSWMQGLRYKRQLSPVSLADRKLHSSCPSVGSAGAVRARALHSPYPTLHDSDHQSVSLTKGCTAAARAPAPPVP